MPKPLDVHTIAHLARLQLEPAEEAELRKKFEIVKDYFSQLAKLKIDMQENRDESKLVMLHQDQPRVSGIDVSFSPYIEGGYFKVPKVIE